VRGGAVEHDYLTSPGQLLAWSRRIELIDLRDYSAIEGTWPVLAGAGREGARATLEIREATYDVLAARASVSRLRRTASSAVRVPRSSG